MQTSPTIPTPDQTQQAVLTLIAALKADKDLYHAYQANIAMAIKDERDKYTKDSEIDKELMHEIANAGAIRFLNILCEGAEDPAAPLNGAPYSLKPESYLEKLTDLQTKIGYKPGSVHPVAMLGLMGEVGEVSQEARFEEWAKFVPDGQRIANKLNRRSGNFELNAGMLDSIKKDIRDIHKDIILVAIDDDEAFDKELADTFYYLKAVAAGRGLTIEDLARMSYQKVIERRGQVVEGDPAK
ncbi:hypothetical protein [Spirosoma sp.]|uniref:hypothetical protein n=1 Tax=Spirosoma sp. TaxID=1899569 RepID=UPI002633C512|nr:hypothetical protein [Spirosoma sp.]MCX6217679.1 hypothetical protein [Spirosoma sp.]